MSEDASHVIVGICVQRQAKALYTLAGQLGDRVPAVLSQVARVALDVKGLPINRKWFLVKHGHKRFLPSAQTLWNFIARNGKHYLPQP